MRLPETASHSATRSCNEESGTRLSVPNSLSQARRARLSTMPIVCPRCARYMAVGQPRYPSPPSTRTRIDSSLSLSAVCRQCPLLPQGLEVSEADEPALLLVPELETERLQACSERDRRRLMQEEILVMTL